MGGRPVELQGPGPCAESYYYLAAALDDVMVEEGSLGLRSPGVERPRSAAPCRAETDLSACDQGLWLVTGACHVRSVSTNLKKLTRTNFEKLTPARVGRGDGSVGAGPTRRGSAGERSPGVRELRSDERVLVAAAR
jgi:hypothetical protein